MKTTYLSFGQWLKKEKHINKPSGFENLSSAEKTRLYKEWLNYEV